MKRRRIYGLGGIAPQAHWGVHNADVDTLARGILERVLLCKNKSGVWASPPQPPQVGFNLMLYGFYKAMLKLSYEVDPMTRHEFVASYVGGRRKIYQKALDRLEMSGLCYKDSNIKIFVKAEKIPFHMKKDPAPRVIQPRDPKFHVEFGRYVKPMERVIYKAIDKLFGAPTVMKGYNSEQVGRIISDKWHSFHHPVAIGMDASRFDQHVSRSALQWVMRVTTNFVRRSHRKQYRALYRRKFKTYGAGYCLNGKVKYNVDYGLTSGDMDTALVGCLLMCSMLWTYLKQKGLRADVIDMGDDSVVILERDDLDWFLNGLDDWFSLMGFDIVAEEPVYVLEKLVFCQCQPINTGTRWIMVRQYPSAWSKDCVSLIPLTNKTIFERWCTSIGLCGLSWLGGVPIYGAFYRSLVFSGRKGFDHPAMDLGNKTWSKGMHCHNDSVTPEARCSFYYAFGIMPDEQIALERGMRAPSFSLPTPRWETIGFSYYF